MSFHKFPQESLAPVFPKAMYMSTVSEDTSQNNQYGKVQEASIWGEILCYIPSPKDPSVLFTS